MAPTPGVLLRVLEWLYDVILISIFIQFSGSNRPIFCFLESIFQLEDPCPTLNGTRRATMPQLEVLARRSEPMIFCCISLECKCAFCFKFLVNEPPNLKAALAGNATTRRSRPVRVTVAGARLGPQLENSPFPCPLRLILRPGTLNGPGEGTFELDSESPLQVRPFPESDSELAAGL
jgi:hypothetical protein